MFVDSEERWAWTEACGAVGIAVPLTPNYWVSVTVVGMLLIRVREVLAEEEGRSDVVEEHVVTIAALPVVAGRGMGVQTRSVKDCIPAIVLLDKVASRVERRTVVRERHSIPCRLA